MKTPMMIATGRASAGAAVRRRDVLAAFDDSAWSTTSTSCTTTDPSSFADHKSTRRRLKDPPQ
jgi:hypothetical protein